MIGLAADTQGSIQMPAACEGMIGIYLDICCVSMVRCGLTTCNYNFLAAEERVFATL